jgi:hypothetical protein
MRRRHAEYADYYRGVRMVPYDLLKELAVALIGVTVVVIALAAALSSPDVPSDTIQGWARQDPVDFVTTATGELAGSTTSAGYGAPYNNGSGAVQSWGPLEPQQWAGVHQPVDSVNQFVLQPLKQATTGDATLSQSLSAFTSAGADQQSTWLDAYTKALGNASTTSSGDVSVASGDYGPVPLLMSRLLGLARTGALDGLLLASERQYQTDDTAPLLFMGDGSQFSGLAENQNLLGSQWGVMNETGRYPGQAWLWLYTMWYQIAPFNRTDNGFLGISSSNTDLAVVGTMGVLSLLLLFLPFIPGLRDIPRWIPVHRLIWRRRHASPPDDARIAAAAAGAAAP